MTYSPILTRQLLRFIVRQDIEGLRALVVLVKDKDGVIGGYHMPKPSVGGPPVFTDDTEYFDKLVAPGRAFAQLDQENGWETCGVWLL